MANELSTAGVTVGYAFESSTGVRPEFGYQRVPGVKSTPDLNPEPTSLEVTTLEDEEYKRYITGIKAVDGALPLMCNNTNEFQGAWYTLCKLSDAKRANDLATWFAINVPKLDQSFYIQAIPTALGVIGMDTDSVSEVQAYISPNDIAGWQDKPTDPAVYITPITTQELEETPLEITPGLSVVGAEIATVTSSDEDVATVTTDGTDIVITQVGLGDCEITATTTSGTGFSAGTTIVRIKSI